MEDDNLTEEEKHQIWMKNSGYLYDRLMIQKLKWPSLTFQWLPFKQQTKDYIKYQFIYASHSSGGQQTQHMYIGEVTFPQLKNINDPPQQMQTSKMRNIFKFTHQFQINKARHFETNPELIATRTDNSPIAIFQKGQQFPVSILSQQMSQGFSLQWKHQGLISADTNGNIYIWRDLQNNQVSASMKYQYQCSVNDTKWVTQQVIVTVNDDGNMVFWDLREPKGIVQKALTTLTQEKETYCVAVNPQNCHIILTGGQDKTVKIWDTRNLNAKLHKFDDHQGQVLTLDWSSHKPNIFASGSSDHKVKIWDLMRVGFQIPKDLGGTDELLFTHQGHQGSVNDLSWNPHAMLLGSCEQDKNTLQFYQISNYIHDFQYAEDVQYLRQQCFQ